MKPLPSWMHEPRERDWLGDWRLPDPRLEEQVERYRDEQAQRPEDSRRDA